MPNSTGLFAIIDEIANHKKVCQTPICQHVVDLFMENPCLLYLCDLHQTPYEIPVAVFVGKSTILQLKFTHMFGESAQNRSAMFGPYFYFTSLDHALESSPAGVVRFALFAGNTKIVENMPYDPCDESATNPWTSRITDYNGKWATEYDSIYVNTLELDDHTYTDFTPILAVKKYEQQIPLSYHLTRGHEVVLL